MNLMGTFFGFLTYPVNVDLVMVMGSNQKYIKLVIVNINMVEKTPVFFISN